MRVKKNRFFYGWWLLAAGTLSVTLQGGFFTYGLAAFFVPLVAELGASRGTLAAAFSFTRIESGLLGPIEGFLIDRFGPRRIMIIGYALFGLGFLLFSQVHSLLGFFLVFPLLALGGSLAGLLPVITAVTNWFVRRRSLALGISSAGVQLGGMAVPLVALAITAFGWQRTALGIAIMIWLFGFPLAMMMKHRPQPYGYLPDGDRPEGVPVSFPPEGSTLDKRATPVLPVDPVATTSDFTPKQALKTPAFWLLAVSHSLSLLIIGAVTIHEIPLLVDAGMSYETAAAVLGFMTGVALVGRVSGGFIGDKLSRKFTLMACFFLMSAGLLVLSSARSLPQAVVFAVLYGLGYGARAPLLMALRGDYFGPRNFGTIMGFSQPVMMIGSFLGPIAAGYAFDVQGSYRMAFIIIALVNLIGALLVLFIRKPAPPQQLKPSP